MARIRTIKPEFPQSESIGRVSREARLLFIQLWTIADDEGRARAASRMLASLLYPYDDDAPKLIEAWMAELEGEGLIRIFENDGSRYLDIPKWLTHQKIDRPSKSRLPEYSTSPREDSRALDADLGPSTSTKDSEAYASAAADAAEEQTDEQLFFSEGKEFLGPNSGGLLVKIARALGDDWARGRRTIAKARSKQDGREWLARIARGPPADSVEATKHQGQERWNDAFAKLKSANRDAASSEDGGTVVRLLPSGGG